MRHIILTAGLLAAAVSFPLHSLQASDVQPLVLSLPAGQATLDISATEMREVEQDLLVATLRIEDENIDPKTLQDKINRAMTGALAEAEKYNDVKASTQGYRIYQYDQNAGKKNLPRDEIWKAQQSLVLKSKNKDALLDLAGKIQDKDFLMSGLNYQLSPALAAQITDDMLEDALIKLQTRAERAAKALGKSKAELREVNVQGNTRPRSPVYARSHKMMAMSADVEMAAPAAAPGETTMTLSVSAKALLKP